MYVIATLSKYVKVSLLCQACNLPQIPFYRGFLKNKKGFIF